MSTRVYLGRLPRDAEQRDVEKLIGEFGRTKDIRLLTGYAFVEFEDSRDAKDACRELDNSRFMGERIIVELAKGDRERRPRNYSPDSRPRRRFDRPARSTGEFRLKVLGLPNRTSWQDLKDLMRKAGEVQYTDVTRDGDGIVDFSNEKDMEEAIRLFDDYDYNGSRLSVKKGEAPSGQRDSFRDTSPPRRRDDSPPRRRDDSPPRRRNDSPPRRRDDSPPRRRDDRDNSPPRRRDDRDNSPPRRRASRSPEANGRFSDRD